MVLLRQPTLATIAISCYFSNSAVLNRSWVTDIAADGISTNLFAPIICVTASSPRPSSSRPIRMRLSLDANSVRQSRLFRLQFLSESPNSVGFRHGFSCPVRIRHSFTRPMRVQFRSDAVSLGQSECGLVLSHISSQPISFVQTHFLRKWELDLFQIVFVDFFRHWIRISFLFSDSSFRSIRTQLGSHTVPPGQ